MGENDTPESGAGGVTGDSPAPEDQQAGSQTPVDDKEAKGGETGAKPEGGDSPAPESGQKHATAQDRIKYLLSEIRRRDEELEKIRQEAQAGGDKQPPPDSQEPADSKPRIEDYETLEDYADALAMYRAEQVKRSLKEELEAEAKQKQAQRELSKQWEQFFDRAAQLDPKQYPEIDKAIRGDGVVYSEVAKEFVRTSELGPQLAYHFYENPDVALRISRLPFAAQVEHLTRLQEDLATSTKKQTQTNAPPPINPESGTGATPGVDLDKMPIEEFMERENKRMWERRLGR